MKKTELELKTKAIIDKISSINLLNKEDFTKEVISKLTQKGIYFIYYLKTIIYIGCSHSRILFKRCEQYFTNSKTGNHLKNKLEKFKVIDLNKYTLNYDEKKLHDELINGRDIFSLINEFKIKSLSSPNFTKEEILLHEALAIYWHMPILNIIN